MLVILGLASVVAASASPINSTSSQPTPDFFNLFFNLLQNSGTPVSSPFKNEIPALKNSGIPAFNNYQNSGSPAFNSYQNSGIPAFNNYQNSGTPTFNGIQNSGIPAFNNYQYAPGNNNYNYNSNLPNMQSLMTCLSSTGGGSGLQSSIKIFRAIIPAVTAVTEKIKIIASQSEPSLVLRGIAEIIRELEPMGDKPEFQDLKECWTKLSPDSQNGQSLRGLEDFCNGNNKINMDSIATIGDQLEQIAELVGSFDARTGEKMGNWIDFGTKVTARLQEKLESSECSQLGSLSAVADIFDDIASLGGSLDFNLDSSAGTYKNNY